MDVGVFHHLPTGGALRVLAEWTKLTSAERITVYTHNPEVHRFAPLSERADVIALEPAQPRGVVDALRILSRTEQRARTAADRIDGSSHDVVFALPDQLTQAPAVLEHLRTPVVYYAPEPLRTAYEARALLFPGSDLFDRLSRLGLNPVERMRKRLDRRAMRSARRVVTHSRFTAAQLEQIYRVQAEVIPLGVSIRDFAAHGVPVQTEGQYVLAVGALHPLKGHDFVIDAMASLPAPRPRLVIVGDRGVVAPALRARASEQNVLLDLVTGVPFTTLVSLFQNAAVVACGQVQEPFGLVPLEAMAAGRAVVAVDEGGFRETVEDGKTGLLAPRETGAFGAALGRLLVDPELAERLGAAGRDSVAANWTWDACVARLDRTLSDEASSGGHG
jgi:glycosyltransferase involved in cell wall biosynthesis